jgi:hypothetical protein
VPPPPLAAGVDALPAELVLDELLPPPQPASASSAVAAKMLSCFMAGTLLGSGDQELQ